MDRSDHSGKAGETDPLMINGVLPSIRETHFLLFLVVAGATAVALMDLGTLSFWEDEAQSMRFAEFLAENRTLDEGDPYHPPGYYLWLSTWIEIWGTSEWVARFASVVFFPLTIWITYLISSEFMDVGTSRLIAPVLAATSPFSLLLFREARPYGALIFFSTMAIYLYIRLRRQPRSFLWIPLFLTGAISVFFHYGGLLMFLPLLLDCLFRRSADARFPIRFLLCFGAVLLSIFLWTPGWVQDLFHLLQRMTSEGAGSFPGGVIGRSGYGLFCLALGETIFPWTWWITVPAFLAYSTTLWLVCWSSYKRGLFSSHRFLFLLTLFLPVLAWSIPENGTIRGMAIALPGLWLTAASGLRELTDGKRILTLVVLLSAVFYSNLNLYTGHEYHHPVYREPAKKIAKLVREISKQHRTEVLLSQPHQSISYYLRSSDVPLSILLHGSRIRVKTGSARVPFSQYLQNRFLSGDWLIFIERVPGPIHRPERVQKQNSKIRKQLSRSGFVRERWKNGKRTLKIQKDPASATKENVLKRPFPRYRFKLYLYRKPAQKSEHH